MTFKPVSQGSGIDIKKHKDQHFIGTYVGSTKIVTHIGPQTVWNFVGENGEPFGVYGFTMLNLAMKNVAENSLVRIKYLGTKFVKTKFKPAGQDVHQVYVEVDDEATPDDTAAPAAGAGKGPEEVPF